MSGTVELDEFGNGTFTFTLDSDDYEFRVRVSPTQNVYDPETIGVESMLMNPDALTYEDRYHLHLTTGDLTETSIFLGTDDHNVRTKVDGSIEITAHDYDEDENKVWGFNRDGSITFPDNTIQLSAAIDIGGQQTVYVNATTAEFGLTLESLTGTIILVLPEEGYTETGVTHVLTLPVNDGIQIGTRITIINANSDNIEIVGWPGPPFTLNSYGTAELILVAGNELGPEGSTWWWVTNSFYWLD
jgi:hypothetical protein